MTERYVLLGDVVRSREVDDRDAFRSRLETTRTVVSDTYGTDFVAGPSMLKGIDELGGVLRSIDHIYDIALEFADGLHPHPIRLAVAYGQVDVGEDETDVSQMAGEGFHRASELLESVEETGLRFDLDTGSHPLDTAVADEINLLLERREAWTDRQRQIVRSYERLGSQYTVADQLGVSQQAVSNALQSVSWPFVETVETRLRETLEVSDP
ncbi:SatD family protein [Halobacteria archaeon AArc-m2/3/4]|uniref:SatD family protein n=1 Tax=Natronoglomus mannanivorans TaxID=2979990 RepID=A0AAP2YWW6_9EURY|nr:SatD family protein [Halobacteria archaeon AArc-xg1-1]MCU4971467.1 SatD family protein [Halobacteria archaeon AArc-m2/3/4]